MTTNLNPKTMQQVGKSGIEGTEKYLLHKRREIIPLLKALAKKPDLITAKIPESDHKVITAVLDILPNRDLIILDYGPNESLNKKLMAAERIVCTTHHEMVETRFNCSDILRVKYKGAPAFAAPIPASVLHLQRRQNFRIKPLMSHPAFITLIRDDAHPLKLKIIDIGAKGLSLEDKSLQLELSDGDQIENCKLTLPANPSVQVNLEIRYTTNTGSKEGQTAHRVGGKFINMKANDEFTLQRFINMVQMEHNAKLKG